MKRTELNVKKCLAIMRDVSSNLERYLTSRGVSPQAAKTCVNVLKKSLHTKEDKFGFHSVSSKSFITKGCYHYKNAVKEELLESDGLYKPGLKSYGYRPTSILMDLLYDYWPDWECAPCWEPNHSIYPTELMKAAVASLESTLTSKQVVSLNAIADHARAHRNDSFIKWWSVFTDNDVRHIRYKYAATGRIYTPLQTMPKNVAGLNTRSVLFPGCWDFDLRSSHTQAMCDMLGLELKEEWLEIIKQDKKGYLKRLGNYKPASSAKWPFVKSLQEYFKAREMPRHNACGLARPDLSNEDVFKQWAKYHAFYCQGWEAAYIHRLVVAEHEAGNMPLMNFHDGAIFKRQATKMTDSFLYKQQRLDA
jgi:hypothetical protein